VILGVGSEEVNVAINLVPVGVVALRVGLDKDLSAPKLLPAQT